LIIFDFTPSIHLIPLYCLQGVKPPCNPLTRTQGSFTHGPPKRRGSLNALLGLADFSTAFERAAIQIQHEVVLEATLHVTSFQAGYCKQQYAGLRTEFAPDTFSLDGSSSDEDGYSSDEEGLAVCLATPPDPADEEAERNMRPFAASRRIFNRLAR
jgi:hypothetical protein